MSLTKSDLQRVRELRDKRCREAEGLYVVENAKVVTELLAAGQRFEVVYATSDFAAPVGATSVRRVNQDEMARMSHLPTPSGVLAIGRITRSELTAGELRQGLTLALDGIQDPGNVGTLVRIADWFGCARVLLSPDCADLFSQKVINASMGSFARMRVIVADLPAALSQAGVPVLVADLEGESVQAIQPLEHAVLVIGSEGRGPSPAVQAVATRRVTIPRHGAAESLNAAVAAGIVCAALRRNG